MRIDTHAILLTGLAIILTDLASAQKAPAPTIWPPAWAVPSSPARIRIEPVDHTASTILSYARVCVPNPDWSNRPFRIFTDAGNPIRSETIWSAPGEPATVVFDSSARQNHYWIYLGSHLPDLPLTDGKAGVWLETREGDGKPVTSLPDMMKAWNQSRKVLGRSLVEGINEGGNRFGPQTNLLMHMQGWYENNVQQHLQLATISSGASFVLVDGKEVVEWPGLHDFTQGLSGQHQGAIDLSAGIHQFDYYYSFVRADGGTNPVMACLVAKRGAQSDWALLQPERQFFRPIINNVEESYDVAASLPLKDASNRGENIPGVAIQWANQEQSIISSDIPNIGLIALQLSLMNPPAGNPPATINWTFDDGTMAQGQIVQHLFLQPGMHTVTVAAKNGEKTVGSLTQQISVHADWEHAFKQPNLWPQHEAEILKRDPATFSAGEIVNCLALFANFEKPDSIAKLVPAVGAKMKGIVDDDLTYVKDAALVLAREDWAHVSEKEQLLRVLIDRVAAVSPPSTESALILSECKLALTQVVLDTTDHLDEVRSLVSAINPAALTKDEPRRLNLLRADLLLATGDAAGARQLYEAQTEAPSGPDLRSSIRHTARIGQARAFMDRKDFESAEEALQEVAWQTPIEKMSSDWAVTRLRLYQAENLSAPAYLWAKRLLPVVSDSSRSEWLFRLIGLAEAQGNKDLAHQTFSELLGKHPYSEEAAEAKQKWPDWP